MTGTERLMYTPEEILSFYVDGPALGERENYRDVFSEKSLKPHMLRSQGPATGKSAQPEPHVGAARNDRPVEWTPFEFGSKQQLPLEERKPGPAVVIPDEETFGAVVDSDRVGVVEFASVIEVPVTPVLEEKMVDEQPKPSQEWTQDAKKQKTAPFAEVVAHEEKAVSKKPKPDQERPQQVKKQKTVNEQPRLDQEWHQAKNQKTAPFAEVVAREEKAAKKEPEVRQEPRRQVEQPTWQEAKAKPAPDFGGILVAEGRGQQKQKKARTKTERAAKGDQVVMSFDELRRVMNPPSKWEAVAKPVEPASVTEMLANAPKKAAPPPTQERITKKKKGKGQAMSIQEFHQSQAPQKTPVQAPPRPKAMDIGAELDRDDSRKKQQQTGKQFRGPMKKTPYDWDEPKTKSSWAAKPTGQPQKRSGNFTDVMEDETSKSQGKAEKQEPVKKDNVQSWAPAPARGKAKGQPAKVVDHPKPEAAAPKPEAAVQKQQPPRGKKGRRGQVVQTFSLGGVVGVNGAVRSHDSDSDEERRRPAKPVKGPSMSDLFAEVEASRKKAAVANAPITRKSPVPAGGGHAPSFNAILRQEGQRRLEESSPDMVMVVDGHIPTKERSADLARQTSEQQKQQSKSDVLADDDMFWGAATQDELTKHKKQNDTPPAGSRQQMSRRQPAPQQRGDGGMRRQQTPGQFLCSLIEKETGFEGMEDYAEDIATKDRADVVRLLEAVTNGRAQAISIADRYFRHLDTKRKWG